MSRVCIGMPVYNGERYIANAIDSILSQTYQDFKLIILDNASTDQTQRICEEYASNDQRVEYHRNPSNIGAPQNFNAVLELSNSEYFKWAAHDDVLEPSYLAECVRVLDQHKNVVVCHTEVKIIDEEGVVVREYQSPLTQSDASSPETRYADFVIRRHSCYDVFGVIRSAILKKTPGIGGYLAADLVLLAELAMAGKIHVIPEKLFLSRDHSDRSINIPPHQRAREWWAEPGRERTYVFPYWRIFLEHIKSVNRALLDWGKKLGCYKVLCKWLLINWRFLGGDVKIVLRQLLRPVFGSKISGTD